MNPPRNKIVSPPETDLRDIVANREDRENPQEGIIHSSRYTIDTGIVYGYGSWGTVYAGRDNLTGEDVAIKVFDPSDKAKEKMKKRKLTENKAMDSEAVKLSACSRVVPRRLEVDENGKRFIVMPHYGRFLDNILDHVEKARPLDSKGRVLTWEERLGEETFESYALDIATAYEETHSRAGLDRVHGDGHPGNFAVNLEGRLLLNDFGTSTIEGLGMTESPRDNVGWFLTRAPELFQEGSHPTRRSDVWSATALIYKLKTGTYPLEGLSYEEISSLSVEKLQEMIEKRIKGRIKDKKLKKFFLRGLSIEDSSRFYDGSILKHDLKKSLDKAYAWNEFKRYARRFGLPSLILGGLTGISIYGASQIPKRPEIPTAEMHGLLYQPKEEMLDGQIVQFEAEDNREALETRIPDGMLFQGFDRYSKLATKSKVVAYFLKCYSQAFHAARTGDRITDYQQTVYRKFITQEEREDERKKLEEKVEAFHPVVAKSIEAAINHCRTKDNKVDIEDVMVVSRNGPLVLDGAKEKAGSSDYLRYRKYLDGDEKKFIDMWLAYYHQDR